MTIRGSVGIKGGGLGGEVTCEPGEFVFTQTGILAAALAAKDPSQVYAVSYHGEGWSGADYVYTFFRGNTAASLINSPSEALLTACGWKPEDHAPEDSPLGVPWVPTFGLVTTTLGGANKEFYTGDDIGYNLIERNFIASRAAIQMARSYIVTRTVENIAEWEPIFILMKPIFPQS